MLTILAVTVVLWLSIQYLNSSTGKKSYWVVLKTAQANDSPGLQVSSKWSLKQSKISTHKPISTSGKAGEAKTEAVPWHQLGLASLAGETSDMRWSLC